MSFWTFHLAECKKFTSLLRRRNVSGANEVKNLYPRTTVKRDVSTTLNMTFFRKYSQNYCRSQHSETQICRRKYTYLLFKNDIFAQESLLLHNYYAKYLGEIDLFSIFAAHFFGHIILSG